MKYTWLITIASLLILTACAPENSNRKAILDIRLGVPESEFLEQIDSLIEKGSITYGLYNTSLLTDKAGLATRSQYALTTEILNDGFFRVVGILIPVRSRTDNLIIRLDVLFSIERSCVFSEDGLHKYYSLEISKQHQREVQSIFESKYNVTNEIARVISQPDYNRFNIYSKQSNAPIKLTSFKSGDINIDYYPGVIDSTFVICRNGATSQSFTGVNKVEIYNPIIKSQNGSDCNYAVSQSYVSYSLDDKTVDEILKLKTKL